MNIAIPIIATALIASGIAPLAARAEPASGVETAGPRVDDATLAEQRGKYITPDQVSYFGVAMDTSWQGADGVTIGATLLIRVDFAATQAGAPQVAVGWRHEGDSAMDVATPGTGISITLPGSNGDLGSVNGAVQSQVIAGSDNRVSNGMAISVVPITPSGPAAPGDMVPLSGNEVQAFGNGSTLQFVSEGNRAGFVIGNAGGDHVRQMIDGSIGQAAQNVTLQSSGNTIVNGMGITFGYQPGASTTQLGLQAGLSALPASGF